MSMYLRRLNGILSFIVILFGIYIVALPFLPQIEYWIRDKSPEYIAPYSGKLAEAEGNDTQLPTPIENRLVIPAIGINEEILESNSISAINNGGTWRLPNTAKPTEDKNTVIVGHRFFGSDASTFYHLDKVKIGQLLAVYWEGKELLYEVVESKIVSSSAIEIEAPTDKKQLTIYTCTPIWTAKDRLVIIAKPIDSNSTKLLENM
jgi:sortase A